MKQLILISALLLADAALAANEPSKAVSSKSYKSVSIPLEIEGSSQNKEHRGKLEACLTLARGADFVEDQVVKAEQWVQTTDETFTWRVTETESGLQCRELIKGSYNLQFGAAKKVTCRCAGKIEVVIRDDD